MSERSVHWHDGMFLRPHHFQLGERHGLLMSRRQAEWGMHYGWGLRSLAIDDDALGNRRFAVRSLRARLRDGTLVDVPQDGVLGALDLSAVLEHEPSVTVYLAVPLFVLGKPNAPVNGSAEATRYLIQAVELEDENSGVNPQKLQVCALNLKMVLSGQDLSGLEVLPIARIERPVVSSEGPQLDRTFIPPVLACDAWHPLQVDILQGLCDRVGKKIHALASQVLSRDVNFDSQTQGDALLFAQLRIANEIYPRLRVIAYAQGIHPFMAYLELCEIVGRLAIFDDTRRVPDLPLYDHNDLGPCFFEVLRYIDALLAKAIEPQYQERAFLGTGLRMQVSMEPAWMESSWDVFIGVKSPLEHDDVVKLLTEPGRLDMKVGSSDRADAIFRQGQAGLRFAYCPQPPRALPTMPTLTWFQVSRASPQNEWQHVQHTLTLALRLNEHLIAGNIQGQRVLKIKTGGVSTTMQFTLYVVPNRG